MPVLFCCALAVVLNLIYINLYLIINCKVFVNLLELDSFCVMHNLLQSDILTMSQDANRKSNRLESS